MLVAHAADTDRVVNRALVITSVSCCVLVLASFALFGRDQMAGASKHQQNELAARAAVTAAPVPVHHAKAQPRRFIDGAAKLLTSPFDSVVHSNSQWVLRLVPTLFALLVYGAGLGYLARFSRGLSHGLTHGPSH